MTVALWASYGFAKTPQEIQANIDRIQREAFGEILKYTEQQGIQLYIGGSTVVRMAFTAPPVGRPARLSDFASPGQDMDIMIDGSYHQRDRLNAWLKEHYPEYKWDQGLRRTTETETFRLQDTDSLSTVYLRMSSKPSGSSLRNLRRVDNDATEFLKDIAERRIHFLTTGRHAETEWFIKGKNPEIFAVIRYFNNVGKFGVEPDPKDIETINGLIDSLNIEDLQSEYTSRRVQELAQTLLKYQDRLGTYNGEKRFHVGKLLEKLDEGCIIANLFGAAAAP